MNALANSIGKASAVPTLSVMTVLLKALIYGPSKVA